MCKVPMGEKWDHRPINTFDWPLDNKKLMKKLVTSNKFIILKLLGCKAWRGSVKMYLISHLAEPQWSNGGAISSKNRVWI